MPELGRRASQHNPGRPDCDPRSSDPWSGPLVPDDVVTAAGSSPLQSPSSHGPESTSCPKQQLENARRLGVAAGYQRTGITGSNAWSLAEFALQRADPDGLLSTSSPMEKRFTSKHIAHVDPGDFAGLNPVLHQESG
jgi:hypothetical protein